MLNRKWLLFFSFCILALVFGLLVMLEDSIETEQKTTAPYVPSVSVVILQSQDNEGRIQTFAEVKPRWAVTLKSQVSGEVIEVSNKAMAGQATEKGTFLVRIEDSAYQVAVREAEHALSSANIDLTRQRVKTERAARDWQRMGIKTPPTALALNKPQLDLAEKLLVAAQSRLSAARKKLTHTSITAPFSGVVTVRNVNIGQSISEGEELLQIVDNIRQDIVVSLSKQQWIRLAENWQNQPASIYNLEGSKIAQARIKRGGGFLDQKTRQYKLFLELESGPANKTLPGDYVQVSLPGRIAGNSLAVPQNALTRNGFVWFVDDDNRLRKFTAKVVFYSDDRIIIETPSRKLFGKNYPSTWRIATTPLASFLAGNRVRANMEAGN